MSGPQDQGSLCIKQQCMLLLPVSNTSPSTAAKLTTAQQRTGTAGVAARRAQSLPQPCRPGGACRLEAQRCGGGLAAAAPRLTAEASVGR